MDVYEVFFIGAAFVFISALFSALVSAFVVEARAAWRRFCWHKWRHYVEPEAEERICDKCGRIDRRFALDLWWTTLKKGDREQ